MLTFDMQMIGIDVAFKNIQEKAEAALRPSAYQGSKVYYDALMDPGVVPVSEKGHWFHGTSYKSNGTKYWFEPGSLKSALYQAYSDSSSNKTKSEYHVAWNHRKVPYGFMVALGTKRGAKANDFIGKAKLTVQQQAINAMQTEFAQRMSK